MAVIACHLLQLHLIMFYWVNRPPDWQITAALVILAYALAAGVFARDLVEYLRSLAHVANLIVMGLLCLNVRIGRGEEVGRSLALFCVLASAVALVVIVQAISFTCCTTFAWPACSVPSRLRDQAARSTCHRRSPHCRGPTARTPNRRWLAGS